jgi:hypothetical protein
MAAPLVAVGESAEDERERESGENDGEQNQFRVHRAIFRVKLSDTPVARRRDVPNSAPLS